MEPIDTSLFKRIGGYEAIDLAVERFYAKVMADDRIAHHFAGVDWPRQRAKQRRFLSHVFGGPAPWDGKELRHAHRHLKLGDSDFDAVAEHLAAALDELGVEASLVAEVMVIVESSRDDVLDR